MKKTIEIDLTEARKIYGQNAAMDALLLQNFTEKELTKKELPKSWEELERVKGYFIGSSSGIGDWRGVAENPNKNTFKTKKQAESALAMAQLSQLMAVYNDGWEPDWGNGNLKYCIWASNNVVVTARSTANTFLSFKTLKLRDEFLKNFRPLIEQYFML